MLDIVPIFGIIFGIGGPVTIIIFIVIYQYKKRQLQGQEIMAAIEKGVEVSFPPPKKLNYLSLGLIWTFVGVAFTLALWFSARMMEAAAWGFLPIAVGLAFLLIALVEGKKKSEEGEEV